MKQEHLIPANVLDIGTKLLNSNLLENERLNYIIRLETIRDYCITTLNKQTNIANYNKNKRKAR